MPSERASRILRAKSDLPTEAIAKLSEGEAWRLIYEISPPGKPKPKLPEVCLTGFETSERPELEAMAERHGYRVAKSVTKDLKILVVGEAPGPKKLQKALDQGVPIMNEEEFTAFLAKRAAMGHLPRAQGRAARGQDSEDDAPPTDPAQSQAQR